jgi:hypothetical protein
MKRKYFYILITILALNIEAMSQQYSFSVFTFRIYDANQIVQKFNNVVGFENQLIGATDLDSTSDFCIKAIYADENLQYHRINKHKPGIWILYSENVRKYRPIRFLSIEKKTLDGKKLVMNIFLNYNYHSCKMPCAFGKSEFNVCDILFTEGNFEFLSLLSLDDWQHRSKKIIKFKPEIPDFIKENNIDFWDNKRKN